MSYVICKHINIKLESHFSYAIFKTDSYEWSDWHSNLVQAINTMQSNPKIHKSDYLKHDTIVFLSREKHLQLNVIPELLPYSELLAQYPELFL